MRKIIGAMKISVDGKTEGPEGYADWVEAWSDDFGLTPQIDACVLGSGMYPNTSSTGPRSRMRQKAQPDGSGPSHQSRG
jgi:hypothetical protein